MSGREATGEMARIRAAIETVREERLRGRLAPPKAAGGTHEFVRRVPLLGPALRWAYGLARAPGRIRDLLTLIRLAEMESSRGRAETRRLGLELESALAALRRRHEALAGQVAVQAAALRGDLVAAREAIAGAREELAVLGGDLAACSDRVAEQGAGLERAARGAARDAAELRAALQAAQEETAAKLDGVEKVLAGQAAGLRQAVERLAPLEDAGRAAAAAARTAAAREEAVDRLYGQLEERFRGPQALVRERQAIYLPVMEELPFAEDAPPVLDLGCGRGEWLGLLQAAGVAAAGVDRDPVAVAACRRAGLQVTSGDVHAFLGGRAAESARAVTAFHVLEHMPFAMWLELVEETWRVLLPGGVAIFETPNPGNLIVSGTDFHLDPTHVRPIPSQLLLYVLEQRGFGRCRVMELHPREADPPPADSPAAGLLQAHLQGPQDYAVVAWKPRTPGRAEDPRPGAG